jgi:hypothetical protein
VRSGQLDGYKRSQASTLSTSFKGSLQTASDAAAAQQADRCITLWVDVMEAGQAPVSDKCFLTEGNASALQQCMMCAVVSR